ncbi:MAG: DNA alkylation repair protein [Bacilli bacterium]|nr:DNA alkylation repair protein [Bacilli bacterium]
MNSKIKVWNRENYQSFLEELRQKENPKYRDFHTRLTITKYPILGINVPECRKIAKEIIQTDIKSFLTYPNETYYEEVLIEGFVIASIKEENYFFQELERFLPKIDNWAICDSFCNSVKMIGVSPEKYFDYWLQLIKRKEPFSIRVGLIILLNFYIKEEYLTNIYQSIDEIKSDHYYVNMGMSWLLAEMYTKYPKETEEYLKKSRINDFTMNKTISKIRDSYRITKKQKDNMLKYKRSKEK